MTHPSRTPCNHFFCIKCLKQVKKLFMICPVCREPIPADFVPKINLSKREFIRKAFPEDFPLQ